MYDLCGSCTKCIEACPTGAIDNYILDSNKCISYLTIEHRDPIPKSFSNDFDDWIYGCDICQEVCPWNIKYEKKTDDPNFMKRIEIGNKSKIDWENLSVDEYQKTFKKSAIKRTKYSGITRNILFNKEN
jgi:epoxyqueuosine reductase